ncbi:MAG: helix-turn-helix domain-containing protein [Pseudomonadales bacterium]|nr:helix-turn-helix domain-containing protein [Pseudomonadales bacterium]
MSKFWFTREELSVILWELSVILWYYSQVIRSIMFQKFSNKTYHLHAKLQMVAIILRMKDHETTAGLLSKLEAVRIKYALRVTGGVQKKAAKMLSLSAPAFSRKIAAHGIDTSEYC